MLHVRQENLPFVGSSHEFVGAEHGDVGVSVFLFRAGLPIVSCRLPALRKEGPGYSLIPCKQPAQ
jgi:hypothetical protein